MTEANVPVSRLLKFTTLCVGLGPPVGGLTAVFALSFYLGPPFLAGTFNFGRAFGHTLFALFGSYYFGAPIALIAASMFAVAAHRYDWRGLGAANVAAIVAATLAILGIAVLDAGKRNLADVQAIEITFLVALLLASVVAMTACWCIARVIGILR